MSTGTLTLTQNSTEVIGSGTLFTEELEAGSVIYVSLGGVNHTLVVSGIASDSQVTLARSFTGETQSGVSWTAIPRDALIGIHAQLAADNAWSRRAAILDKQNWYQVFTGEGTITVTLPDGTTFTGPSWKYLSENMTTESGGVVPVNRGGTGSTTASGARANLELGSAALEDIGFSIGNVATVHSGRWGSANQVEKVWDGIYEPVAPGSLFYESCVIQVLPGPTTSEWGALGIGYGLSNVVFIAKASYSTTIPTGNITVMELWHSHNTTVDTNGFLKRASPVVKIFKDGSYETNDESAGVTVTRLDVGQYLIEGCEALNSDAAWGGIDGGFEIPMDRNKQALIWLDYDVHPDGSILVKTYHRTHPESPAFARNRIGYKNDDDFIETVVNGGAIDIPSDQFVSVRVEMPENSIWNQRQAELAEAALLSTEIISDKE